jgi:hypothetical protein
MIEHLRLRAANAFAKFDRVTLATCGPSGPHVSRVQCKAQGTTLILHVSWSSDHLFNLEHQPEVAILSPEWQLRGSAQIMNPETCSVPKSPLSDWHAIVMVQPIRLQMLSKDSLSFAETIDF